MPDIRFSPLVPACLLLLGAVLILAAGPAMTPRRRHWVLVALSGLSALSLLFLGSGYPAEVRLVPAPWATGQGTGDGLVEWLGEPALAMRVLAFDPFLWVLLLALLAISLAARDTADRRSAPEQAVRLALTAVACGVVLAGNYRSLALALLLFDATAALFALVAGRPRQATGRLLLGVLSSAVLIGLAQGADDLIAHPGTLGSLFALTVWLRVGLYPLVESGARDASHPSTRLAWFTLNLAVGLYLVSASASPWLVWLAGATTVLHGALAWLEASPERALTHAGHALAGGILTMVAVVGDGPGVVAASISVVAAVVALELAPPPPGRPDTTRPQHLWAYLPLLLATASLIGIPFTLGWEGRGALYQAIWQAGALGVLALVVVAEGAALSVLFRFWQRLLWGAPAVRMAEASAGGEGHAGSSQKVKPAAEEEGAGQGQISVWPLLGATLACIPFLIPVLGPRLVVGTPVSGVMGLSALLGLVSSLLWALFLGYGRSRLLSWLPVSPPGLAHVLSLGWLLHGLGYVLDTLGRVILRVRAVFEGEHYLAWAILLALGLGLMILLR